MGSRIQPTSHEGTTVYIWDEPRYSPTEAGRIVGLTVGRVRRWLRGYKYQHGDNVVTMAPVLTRESDSKYASFLDLVDLLFVKKFLEVGFSLQKIRSALAEAEGIVGGHHFAQRSFMTDGKNIFLWVKDSNSPHLLQLFSGGQWVIEDFIVRLARQIDFDEETGFAERWYPAGREGRVVLDPRIAFGAPTIIGTGVRTANIYDLFVGENENKQATAEWLNLRIEDVSAAIGYEQSIAA